MGNKITLEIRDNITTIKLMYPKKKFKTKTNLRKVLLKNSIYRSNKKRKEKYNASRYS